MLTSRGEHFYFAAKTSCYTEFMHPPVSRRPSKPMTWRERLAALRNVFPLFRMIWETSRALTVATLVLRLFRALLPLATLWVSKLILDAVVALIRGKAVDSHALWKLVALEFGLAIVSDVMG